MTPQAPELLGDYLESCKDPAAAASAREWAKQLRLRGPGWKLVSPVIGTPLDLSFSAVIQLAGSISAVEGPQAFQQWHSQALALRDYWIPSENKRRIPPEPCQLYRAVFARVLADRLESAVLPTTLAANLLELLRSDLRWAKPLPFMPGPHTPRTVDQYFFAIRQTRVWNAFRELAEQMRQVLDKPQDNPNSAWCREVAEWLSAADLVINWGQTGWPLSIAEFDKRRQYLRKLWQKGSHDKRSDNIAAIVNELATMPFEPATHCEDSCNSSQVIDVQSAIPLKGMPPRQGIAQLAMELEQSNDPRANSFAYRLRNITSVNYDDAVLKVEELAKAVACLIYVNGEHAAQPNQNTWHEKAKRLLGPLIENSEAFLVLDKQLWARAPTELLGLVVVVGTMPSSKVPAGHIIAVKRPGYLQKCEGGKLQVLCPAQVIVSRPTD